MIQWIRLLSRCFFNGSQNTAEVAGGAFSVPKSPLRLIARQAARIALLSWHASGRQVIDLTITGLMLALMPAVMLILTRKIIDAAMVWIANAESGPRQTLVPIFLMFLMRWFSGILSIRNQANENLMALRLTHYVEDRVISHAAVLDVSFFEYSESYDRLARVKRETCFRIHSMLKSLIANTQAIVTLLSTFMLIGTLAWWLPLVLIMMAIPGLLAQVFHGQRQWATSANHTVIDRWMQYIKDLLTTRESVIEISFWGVSNYFVDRWRQLSAKIVSEITQLIKRQTHVKMFVVSVEVLGSACLYLYIIIRAVADAKVGIGGLVAYAQAQSQAMASLGEVFRGWGDLYEDSLYIEHLFSFLSENSAKIPGRRQGHAPKQFENIRFESVSFCYPGSQQCVISDVSFDITRGEHLALVGENGAGKSTIAKLLMGLYEPTSGRITIDGLDLREIIQEEWQACCTSVFQRFIRYNLTAKENVGIGFIDCLEDMNRIISAADRGGVTQNVEGFPNSWDTQLGKIFKDGHEPSEGIWQRLAMSRAMMRDQALLLFLDEPTASMDARAEYELFCRFNELTQRRTTIMISHRLSWSRLADRIIVFDNGRIVESGDHRLLFRKNGIYAKLFQLQASGYNESHPVK